MYRLQVKVGIQCKETDVKKLEVVIQSEMSLTEMLRIRRGIEL